MDIPNFFAAFDPKDWATAGISVVALVVSIWAVSQTWVFNPRPHWKLRWSGYPFEEERPGIVVQLTNIGDASAKDVELCVRPRKDDPVSVYNVLELPTAHPVRLEISRVTADITREPDDRGLMILPEGKANHDDLHFLLTWRQHPLMWWRRRRSFAWSRADQAVAYEDWREF